jgi:putative heme-binding domain-containing protein
MGAQWDKQLNAVLASNVASPEEKIRALDLMQLLGPYPTPAVLIRLSASTQPEVRAKAAYLMGLHVTDDTNARLVELLQEADPTVRRIACEALVRADHRPAVTKLATLLYDKHRHVAYAARLLLEQLPVEEWQTLVLAHSRPAVLVHGGTALMTMKPDGDAARGILDRSRQLMRGYLTDEDFLGLTRVIQLALLRGGLGAADVAELGPQLAEEYPALDPRMNRELVRLMMHLDQGSALPRMMEQLEGEAAQPEKLHLAMHLRFLKAGWTTPQKLTYLEFCEQSRSAKGGAGVSRYLESAARDFAGTLTPEEHKLVLADAARFPTAALPALVRLPADPGEEMLTHLKKLDRDLEAIDTDASKQLRTGIIAILARSRKPEAFEYLRSEFERTPARRAELAMCLAQDPRGENWPLLVQSLAVLEGNAVEDVLGALNSVPLAPESPEAMRQVILTGLRSKESGAAKAVALLEHWTGQKLTMPEEKGEAALAAWQTWFREQYPDQPDPALPIESEESKWSLDELVKYLNSADGKQGRASYGELVFEKAQCIKCHRFGTRGEAIGPDLTTISRRFQKKEVVQSVLFPSHVISDQFASRSIVTKDGLTYTGLVGAQGENAIVVLDSTGKKTVIERDNIEQVEPHKKSAMPDGLFNTLTLEEIGDLFAYLYAGGVEVAQRPLK